jgi:hypothetical protein
MEEETPYEQFISQMEKVGLRKEFSTLEEKDVTLSEDDEVIYIAIPATGINNYRAISIRGIKEASIKGRIIIHPYDITVKVYGYGGEEAKPEDSVQFSITEFKKGLPSVQETDSHIVYYNYPYRIASSKVRLKKGIIVTKDRRLEIRVMRDSVPLKIAKFGIKIECDKWYKKEESKINLKKLPK